MGITQPWRLSPMCPLPKPYRYFGWRPSCPAPARSKARSTAPFKAMIRKFCCGQHFAYTYTRKEYPDWSNGRISSPLPPLALPAISDKDDEPANPIWLGALLEI